MPEFGVDRAIRHAQQKYDPPPGWATLIPGADPSVDKLDLWVTAWDEPSHSLSSELGTERIEDGSTITDHVVAQPAKLSLIGYISDVSMGPDAPGRAWAQIRKLHKDEAILKVITEWGEYPEMVIKRVDTTQTTRGMKFTLDMQEIVRVGVSRTEMITAASEAPDTPATNRGPEVEAGQKPLRASSSRVLAQQVGPNQFRLGDPNNPNGVLVGIEVGEDGQPLTDAAGNPVFYTIPPAAGDE